MESEHPFNVHAVSLSKSQPSNVWLSVAGCDDAGGL